MLYHVLHFFTELRLFLQFLQLALLEVKTLNLRRDSTLYVCFQNKGLGDICVCRHVNPSTIEKFPVNPSFETRPSYEQKTTIVFCPLVSVLFKKIFFFFFPKHFTLRTPSQAAPSLVDVLPVFAALGICNSVWSTWHAASAYANLNLNNKLEISCSNEFRGAFKFLCSQEPNSVLSFRLAIEDRWH